MCAGGGCSQGETGRGRLPRECRTGARAPPQRAVHGDDHHAAQFGELSVHTAATRAYAFEVVKLLEGLAAAAGASEPVIHNRIASRWARGARVCGGA